MRAFKLLSVPEKLGKSEKVSSEKNIAVQNARRSAGRLMWWTVPAPSSDLPLGLMVAIESRQGALDMQITTIGLDIAKNVFQVHGIDAAEKVVVRKRLRRRQVPEFFKALP